MVLVRMKKKRKKKRNKKKSDELEERNKDAGKNRQEGLDKYKDRDDSGSYYDGKKW